MESSSQMMGPPGPTTIIDGRPFLYFGGTSYLGLAAHPEVIEAGCEALRRYGVHSATSRSRVGSIPPVVDVESEAASFFGAEAAFYFGSGYLSNHILVSAMGQGMEAVLVAGSAHYCVHEAAQLVEGEVSLFEAHDLAELERQIAGRKRILVAANAVGPSLGELADVTGMVRLMSQCERAVLLLDDAHGFGVLGPEGRGLLNNAGLWQHANGGPAYDNVEIVVGGTLSKALGGFGGIIPGTREFIDVVRRSSHYFDGASAPPAAAAGSSAKALMLARQHPELREQLRQNNRFLRSGLRDLGLNVPDTPSAHFGISIGSAQEMQQVYRELLRREIYLPYLATYSGAPPEGFLRVAVFANHTEAQLTQLLSTLKEVL